MQDGKMWLGCCIIARDEKERILFMSFVHAGVGYFQMTSAEGKIHRTHLNNI